MKLKISELEHEIFELKQENKSIYETLVNETNQKILDYSRKLQTTKNNLKFKTQNLSKTKRQEKLLLKGYSKKQMDALIYDIMKNKKAYD